MATLVTEQGIVHYETYGRGRPVLLLHGWLGSWALWRRTIEELGKEFRTYALDFWGFGESGDQGADFSVDNFVLLVNQFMDRLGIVKAPLVGHSMGGTVSLSAAIRRPEKVVKVIVIGSPIHGSSLSPLLKLAGRRTWMDLAETSPTLFNTFMSGLRISLRGYSYLLAKDGRALGNMFASDISKLTVGPFFESIATLRQTDLRPRMGEVKMPVLGIYGKRDLIVNPNQAKVLQQYAPHSKIAMFPDAGHFPMLDNPERFHQTVRDFLNSG
ncbi:MAG: alpha/beta hydrolase [Anaerolineae bacterium]|nr:alpha/beta hydrolase [Anaerolineae bacterium]MBN8618692.1 alpha/beta hydrolase [Anaerolineae bacterium]